MARIVNLRMWKDIGYTDGSTELPSINHRLGTPDLTYDDPIFPSKERMFSQIQIPIDFSSLLNISYINFNLEMDNGENVNIYGWVDDIELKSDTEGSPMTFIDWHVDPWRTYGHHARYGSGFVVRRPSTDHDYWQNYPYRFMQVDSSITELAAMSDDLVWVIICHNKSILSQETKAITYSIMPVSTDLTKTIRLAERLCPAGSQLFKCLNLSELRTGVWDEFMGLNPDNIASIYLSPINPTGLVYTLNDDVIDFPDIAYPGSVYPTNNPGYQPVCHISTAGWLPIRGTGWIETLPSITLYSSNPVDAFPEQTVNIPTVTSTEEHPIYLMGFNGEKVYEVPFGMTIGGNITRRVVVTPLASTLEVRLNGKVEDNIVGLTIDLLLPSFDSNSNAWSSYVYSGQRDYDITNRNMNTLKNTVTGAITGGVMGGILGAGTKNAALPGKGRAGINSVATAAGATSMGTLMGAGIAIGAASSIAGGLTEFAMSSVLQEKEDKLHANQPSQILTSGAAVDNVLHGITPKLVRMKFDDPSQRIITEHKTVNGVSFGESIEDCNSLILAGGPMQITDLIVKGDIPTTVKKWIREKFANGVRIIDR